MIASTIRTKTGASTVLANYNKKLTLENPSSFNIKPKLLEGKVGSQQKFFNMTDGFKNVFACDAKD